MAKKKNTKDKKEKEMFDMVGFALEIPQESFDKLLEAMTEPKKKKGSNKKKEED